MSKYLDSFPRALLEELANGRWLPIVGAGFSRNATIVGGSAPATWAELGRELSHDVDGIDDATGTLEIISAYEHTLGRVALVDKTASLIRAHDAVPGAAHIAFARLGFANVITTNFDFLLEKAYDIVGKGCLPIVDEGQLSSPNRYAGPRVIKFHGDINHPARLVITEDDYDHFLQSYPLMATSVTAMLVDHTAILVGYSLDDPDTRQLLALIRRRLGRLTRPLWTIQIAAPPHVVSRYERRGVKVVNIPVTKGMSLGEQYARIFDELAQYWRDQLPQNSVSSDDRVTADLRVLDEPSRICYFAIPAYLIGWYRDVVFPEVEARGLIPVTARDVFTPPGTSTTKLDALLARATVVVAEITGTGSEYEATAAAARKGADRVLIVREEGTPVAERFHDRQVAVRPLRLEADPEQFLAVFRSWVTRISPDERFERHEPERLLEKREFGAAVISAVSLLEISLGAHWLLDHSASERVVSLRVMLKEASRLGLFRDRDEEKLLENAISKRNEVIHRAAETTGAEARRYVKSIRSFVDHLKVLS